MKPEDVEYQLSRLLDGELPQDQAEAFRQRLSQDPALAEQHRLYQALDQSLSDLAKDMPAVNWDLQRQGIRAVLERKMLLRPMVPSWRGRLLRWSTAAAAAAAVLVALVLGLNWLTSSAMRRPTAKLVVAWAGPKAPWTGATLSGGPLRDEADNATSELAVTYSSAGTAADQVPSETAQPDYHGEIIVVSAGPIALQGSQTSAMWYLDEL
ncbi:MAG: hypothetical protein HQ546_06830 [Planctomycetes bacterium]|nr:hypothetical protein [Planctomycetota bacterium]